MIKIFWPFSVAVASIFWGTAILANQHHLSNLIPALGVYLLAYGITLLTLLGVFFWREHRGDH